MRFLMAASVGPVQGFIAAARKTRDLYAGSWILSEVAKAAAKRLAEEARTELVFPSILNVDDLMPRSALTVSNKILAVVHVDSPRELASEAEKAARLLLRELCGDLRDHPGHHEARMLEHVEEMLEFYAAWVPFPDGGDYKTLYAEVEALLTARKTTRAFRQHMGTPGLLKSSLDGMRETILLDSRERRRTDTRVDENEELDGTGFLKRFVRLNNDVRFESVKQLAEMPYGGNRKQGDDLYYAILMADGDTMGKAIGQMGRDEQREFSKRLSIFADAVRRGLDADPGCMTVFAGGDELIVMIALHRLTEALEIVRTSFQEIVCAGGKQFTISAGAAIVHEMEPLDEAREMARVAKKTAKDLRGKNALCMTEAPRSGAPVTVAGHWDWMLPTLRDVVTAYAEKRLSYGFGHELWDVLNRTPKELDDTLPDLALALAKHKKESNSAAKGLVEKDKEQLGDLMKMMLVARKVARAGEAAGR
jgi:CRISPR-associated protein Cmr2